LYFCALLEGTNVVGYLEFAYFVPERLVHVDYFIIAEEHRSRGRFFLFTEQFVEFLRHEHIDFSLLTAEISLVAEADERPGYAQKLIRLFRSVGLGLLKVDYRHPMLGWGNEDTMLPAKLLVFSPVSISKLTVARYIELLKAIYSKHYQAWYKPLYPDMDDAYRLHVEKLLADAKENLKGTKLLDVEVPESEFTPVTGVQGSSIRKQMIGFAIKLLLSAGAAGLLHWLLKSRTHWSAGVIIGIAVSSFIIGVLLFTIRNRGQIEVIKFILTVVRDLLSH
jgi:hypothetical protein